MKYLGLTIMFVLVFASCMFSNSREEKVQEADINTISQNKESPLKDSITVDTVIGNFRIHYKITDIVDTTLAPFSCDEESGVSELYKVDKQILLNIQKLDTTFVVNNRTINIESFKSTVSNTQESNYYIDMFYLKEVQETSLTFGAILCKFGTNISKEVDVHINSLGFINYNLIN